MTSSVVAITITVALVSATGCGGKTVAEPHLEEIAGVTPAELQAKASWEGEPRQARIRVWTDAAYAAAQPAWKERFTDELDHASQYLTPTMGLALEVVAWRTWSRDPATAAGSAADALGALADTDDGDGVDWVIGLVGAVPPRPGGAPPSLDALGAGARLGKHAIVTGYDDARQAAAVARAVARLPPADQQNLLDARRRHHQTVVLLHALGHTFGAIHETEPSWLMHAQYGTRQASISERNRDIILRGIAHRIGRTPDPADDVSFARELLELVEGDDWGGWERDDRDALISALRERVDAADATALTPGVPAEVRGQLRMIEQMVSERDLAGARDELDRLMTAYPNNAAMRLVDCELRLQVDGGPSEAATASCERAAELAPGDPSALLRLGTALGAAGDLPAAHAVLDRAVARAGSAADAQAMWMAIAGAYRQVNAVTWAEAAAAQAGPDGEAVLAWARGVRNRYGLPADARGFEVRPEDEPAYLAMVRGLLDLVYAGKLDEAREQFALADRKWPDAPGVNAARCDLAMREKQFDRARTHCKAALSVFPDDAWARYLLGILDVRAKKHARAATHLEHAIAADPDLAQAYRALGKLYARTGSKKLDALRTAYQARFGQALPP